MNVLNALLLLPFGMAILYFSIKELLWVVDVTRSGVKAKGQIVDLIEDTMADTRQYYLVIEYSILTGQVLRSKSKQSYINRGINQTVEIIYHKEFPEKMIVNEDKYLILILGMAGGCIAVVAGLWGLF